MSYGPLPIIYDGVRQADLELEHGLKAHGWFLKEVLSHQVPNARIMAFRYDFAKGEQPSWIPLLQQVEKLLYNLLIRRGGVERRPIVFVCYSFGALILKKALLIAKEKLDFRSILESTSGIDFLGCLNDENYPNFAELCLKCAAVEMGVKMKDDAVKALREAEDWSIVKDVMERFRTLQSSFQLCPEPASSLGWDREVLIGVNRDHNEMIMYPPRGDVSGFLDVFMKALSELVDGVFPQGVSIPETASEAPSDPLQTWTVVHRQDKGIGAAAPIVDQGPGFAVVSIPVDDTPSPNTPCFVLDSHEGNRDFVGRTDALDEIHKVLSPEPLDQENPSQRTFTYSREHLDTALKVYSRHERLYKNEIARTQYKIGCVQQDMGDSERGTPMIREAERLRQEIVPPESWQPSRGEGDFDDLVQFW